jgi:hypothetical protein
LGGYILIDYRILPIAFEENHARFLKTATPGTDECEWFEIYLYKLATLADEAISFKVYVSVMLDIFFENLNRRDSEQYAIGVYNFLSHSETHREIAAALPSTPFTFFKQTRNAQMEYTTLPNPENKKQYMIGEQLEFGNYVSFFHVDLFRGLMHGNTPRQCRNCRRFFLLATGYDAIYCNRIAPGETVKTCRKVGAHRKAANPEGKTPAQKMYNTVYNRLKQRHLRKKITHDEWNAAVAIALELKNRAERGELSDWELQELYDGI